MATETTGSAQPPVAGLDARAGDEQQSTLRGRLWRVLLRRWPSSWRAAPTLLATLVVFGIALRVVTVLLYQPSVLQWVDAVRFARVAPTGLFNDFWMPAGYPIFLLGAHSISSSLLLVIILQHLLGVTTALLLYATARRLGAGPWPSLIAPTVVLLDGDFDYLEHILMTETLYLAGIALALYLVSRACARRGAQPAIGWLVACGSTCALVGLVRTNGLVLIVACGLWACAVTRGGWRRRGRAVALLMLPAIVIMCGYSLIAVSVGRYTGLFDMGGWDLYSRVGPFASCSKFVPPPGTEVLCQNTPSSERPGPFYYVWDPESPARKTWGLTPSKNAVLRSFAVRAIEHQPVQYLEAVTADLVHDLDINLVSYKGYTGIPPQVMSFAWRDRGVERWIVTELRRRYPGTTVHVSGAVAGLATYQNVTRLRASYLVVLLLLACCGAAFGRGHARRGAGLLLMSSLLLYASTAATESWDYRYSVPPSAILACAGGVGAAALCKRWPGSRRAAGTTDAAPVETN